MSMRHPSLALALPIVVALVGCNSDDEGVFKQGGNIEGKPNATLLGELEGLGANGEEEAKEVRVAASVKYKVKISSASGASVCNGEINIDILSDFNMKFPEAYVDCVSMRIDLASILGAAGGAGGSTGQGKMTHDGEVLAIESIAGATFDPPRPFLLGPIVQKEDKYKGFKRTSEHVMKGTNDAGEPFESKGKFNINVINHKTSYKDPGEKNIAFDNVMHWEMTSDFDAPAKYGLTFKKWTWYWNTRPIMIPGLVIEGTLKDFIEGGSADMAEALTGVLKFELYVKEYDMK